MLSRFTFFKCDVSFKGYNIHSSSKVCYCSEINKNILYKKIFFPHKKLMDFIISRTLYTENGYYYVVFTIKLYGT